MKKKRFKMMVVRLVSAKIQSFLVKEEMKGEAESSGLTSDEAARQNILYSREQ